MAVFLFWNLNGKPLQNIIANLAIRYEIDVFMFAECVIPPAQLLVALNTPVVKYHHALGIGCEKIEIYTRFSNEFIRPVSEANRFTIRHLTLPGLLDILLAVTHFPSKLHSDEASQLAECMELAQSIRFAEKDVGHSRTALVGDFNMNPFETGVVNASGLHGVMSRPIAQRGKRIVQFREYPFFYNPMWSLFGDVSPGPPGTYYYNDTGHKAFFWNIFDQVLIRPDLLNNFKNGELEILQTDGVNSLASRLGIPDAKTASDHFPLMFKLQF